MGNYGGFKLARTQALVYLHGYYYKTGMNEKADIAMSELEGIAFPERDEAKEANPKKYPSHRPSCPTDAPAPVSVHEIDPKQYW
jgi:hypothetical protein